MTILLTRHPWRPERLAVVDSATGEPRVRASFGRDQDRAEVAALLRQSGYRLLPDGETIEEPTTAAESGRKGETR